MSTVHFRWERRPSQPAADVLRRLIVEALRRLGVTEAEVHVLVTGDDRIRELNRVFRGRDAVTDVLSFPDGDRLPSGSVLLGEIAVSLDAARRQALDLGHSELRELEELVLHGALHLMGYDHLQDRGAMNRVELRMRRELLS